MIVIITIHPQLFIFFLNMEISLYGNNYDHYGVIAYAESIAICFIEIEEVLTNLHLSHQLCFFNHLLIKYLNMLTLSPNHLSDNIIQQK